MILLVAAAEIQMLVQQTNVDGLGSRDLLGYAAASGIGGALAYFIKAIVDRRSISAVAKKEEATAADIVSKAAAELVNPLRLELETVRGELHQVRGQLASCVKELHQLNVQMAETNAVNERLARRNAELEAKLQT